MATYRDYTKEEVARLGREIYEREIRPLVADGNHGKDVVIDIETLEWEIGDDVDAMTDRLHAKHPEAALFHLRVGIPYTARIGGRPWAVRP